MLPLSADRYSKTRASELPVSGRLRRVTQKTTTSVPALVDKEGLFKTYPSNDAQQFNPHYTHLVILLAGLSAMDFQLKINFDKNSTLNGFVKVLNEYERKNSVLWRYKL